MRALATVEDLKTEVSQEKTIADELRNQNLNLRNLMAKFQADLASMESRTECMVSEDHSALLSEQSRVVSQLQAQHALALSQFTAARESEKRVFTSEIEALENQLCVTQDMYNRMKDAAHGVHERARASDSAVQASVDDSPKVRALSLFPNSPRVLPSEA